MKLLVLAAGLGSRFGGVKQLASVGPHGETLLEYNLYDAAASGFDSVVFLLRKEIEDDFNAAIRSRLPPGLRVEIAYQSAERCLPTDADFLARMGGAGDALSARKKPWGTGQALLCAREFLEGESFAVANADDFYGRAGFWAVAGFLGKREESSLPEYCIAGYRLGGVVPGSGSVSRAVCSARPDGYLEGILEHTDVRKSGSAIVSIGKDGTPSELSPDLPVSMNLWGLDSSVFPWAEERFRAFLEAAAQARDASYLERAEFYLPTLLGEMNAAGKARIKVLDVDGTCFGLTNPQDLERTRAAISSLSARKEGEGEGEGKNETYPSPLWEGWKAPRPARVVPGRTR
ncbi:MAG TPA: NTP transferase domain-containing protein [Rectinemataceae bacterium]